jgi:NAD(P)-dependent dehydrogenase (short-subunit alcohol dehydrogenase family)
MMAGMEIKGSAALVTGSNRGIGRSLVEALLDRGATRVYASARNASALESVVALDPRRVRAVPLDITNPDAVRAAAAAASDVTLLVNNAGVLTFGRPLELDPALARSDMETNYFGTLTMVREFAPMLIANGGGAVVNVLTIVALASMPGLAGYNASKAAAWSLTQSYRADLAPHGVAVHAVYPGPVDTDMARGIDLPKTSPAEVARRTLDGVEAGLEDIFPDPMSEQVYSAWRQDHKAVERQFAAA